MVMVKWLKYGIIPGCLGVQLVRRQPSHCMWALNAEVNELIHPQTTRWGEQLARDTFHDKDAEIIRATPLKDQVQYHARYVLTV